MPNLKEIRKYKENLQVISGWNPKTGAASTKQDLAKAREWMSDYESRR